MAAPSAEPVEIEPQPFTPELVPGLFTEQTDRGSTNRWKDGDKVRFKNALPQMIGGWASQAMTGATLRGKVRRVHEWQSQDREKWIAIGTNSKLYLLNQGVLYDITPLRRNVVLTDPFATVNLSTTVTVTDAAHDAEVGDFVRFSGASAVGGITIDGEYQIVTVVDINTYTITHTAAATSTVAAGGGTVTAEYDIANGGEDTGLWYGWGTCTWGTSTWGTPRGVCSTMVRYLRIWSMDNWGEDLLASPTDGPVYYWDRTLGPLSRAVLVPTAPITNQRILVSAENRQLACYGAHDGSAPDPLNIRVSNNEDFTDFVIDVTGEDLDSNAYARRLDSGSRIIGALRTRNGILISTDLAVHIQQPDADLIYTVRQIGEGNGFIGPNAAVDVDGTVYYMAPSRFMMYDGVLQEIPCDVWSKVFGDQTGQGLTQAQADKVYCYHNDAFNEIWWFYPSAVSTENDRYVTYNYRERHWAYGAMARTAASHSGATFGKGYPFAFDTAGLLMKHEFGTAAGSVAQIYAWLESYDITLSNLEPMHVSQIIPDDEYRTNNIRISLKTKKDPKTASYTTKGPYVLSTSATKIGSRARGRQMAILFESGWNTGEATGKWRIGNYTFMMKPDGGGR